MAHHDINHNQGPMEIICVACPKGCRLEVRRAHGEILVSNAGCKQGKEYAVGEINDPRRMVASTVRVNNGLHPLVPVYTESPFPKGLIKDLLHEIRGVQIDAPVKIRQVIIENALDTGINIIASRDLD
jgi:CxxC motif-containing protein